MVDVPVVRIERKLRRKTLPAVRPGALTNIVDLNAFRYKRERALVERRSSRSLLPELGPPCDAEPS